ncbi:MAG: LOG family protein [Candidatus Kapaibacteriota bacterium]|jgi:uncharacterized protein (TIGR00725 family)
MKTAVIFGSGDCSPRSKLYKTAQKLGETLGSKGYNIANGGYFGVMEASAKGAAKFNVERIGVVFKNYKDYPNKYITKIIEANSYLDRLDKLITIGDVFFLLEGGSGTLLEFVSLLALSQRNLKSAPAVCIGRKWTKILRCLNKILNYKDTIQFGAKITIVSNIDEAFKFLDL